jgi:hypothetical protein
MQDDFMLFPGDAVFSYVEQARNNAKNSRVYVLKIAQNNQVYLLCCFMRVGCFEGARATMT